MNELDLLVGRLAGLPAWGVKKGQGSFLTFEFGSPRLIIREPIMDSRSASPRVRAKLARRHVSVAGEWLLWVYTCDWQVTDGAKPVGDSTSSSRVLRAAAFLDGQALTGITLPSRGARTRFAFDLGGVLETRPYDRRGVQWHLYEPGGNVLSWRADRKYFYGPSSQTVENWRAA